MGPTRYHVPTPRPNKGVSLLERRGDFRTPGGDFTPPPLIFPRGRPCPVPDGVGSPRRRGSPTTEIPGRAPWTTLVPRPRYSLTLPDPAHLASRYTPPVLGDTGSFASEVPTPPQDGSGAGTSGDGPVSRTVPELKITRGSSPRGLHRRPDFILFTENILFGIKKVLQIDSLLI